MLLAICPVPSYSFSMITTFFPALFRYNAAPNPAGPLPMTTASYTFFSCRLDLFIFSYLFSFLQICSHNSFILYPIYPIITIGFCFVHFSDFRNFVRNFSPFLSFDRHHQLPYRFIRAIEVSLISVIYLVLSVVSVQYLHRYDSQTHENRLRRWGLLTPESCSYGLISK